MIGQRWTRLSLKKVPLIDRELQTIITAFSLLRERIRKGEMEALEELAELKVKVQERLKDIDCFCQQNQEHECIVFLHPLVKKIQRLVQLGGESSKINEDYNEVPWKRKPREKEAKASTHSTRISVSPLKQNNSSLMKKSVQIKDSKSPSKLASSRAGKEASVRSSKSSLKARMPSQSTPDIEESRSNPIKTFTETQTDKTALQISFNNKQIFSDNQTVFTFTMTREQYQQVMRMKKKITSK